MGENMQKTHRTIFRVPLPATIWLVALTAATVAIATAILVLLQPNPNWFYDFPNVRGPAGTSSITLTPAAQITDFETGGPHRLAVLVTDPNFEWLELARALRAQGVPFTLTEDPARALRHKVILVYPIISGRALAPPMLRALAEHVRTGGTLITHDLAGGGLEQLFGVGTVSASTEREILVWRGASGSAEEAETRFSLRNSEAQMGSYAYEATTARVIASYEDGAPAILCRSTTGVGVPNRRRYRCTCAARYGWPRRTRGTRLCQYVRAEP